jgi:oxygen-independent coproporphyrinogen-3 oxidase
MHDVAGSSMGNSNLAPVEWDSGLIRKYDVQGPRYTSYPTALQFRDDFSIAEYRALWHTTQGAASNIAPLSLYVHVPFCENICYYCACNKIVTRKKEKARDYLNHLETEIRLQSELVGRTRPVTQMHWGGGTPTYLNGAELTELMHNIASHFRLIDSESREYAIEIDPRTVDRALLALLKGLGFNRLSLGIQDFNPHVQRAINREQSYEQVAELMEAARRFGFKSVSFDLIYGLPHQSAATLQTTLDQVIALNPDRIALYNYAHLPDRFPTQRSIDRLALPTAQEKLAMLAQANQQLREAGYLNIGMDHFVRPTDDLALAQQRGQLQRNFQGYSTCMAQDLLGLGVSAITSTRDGFAQNTRDLQRYYAALNAGELPIERGLHLTADDQVRKHVIMRLICNFELDLDDFATRFDTTLQDYFAAEMPAVQELVADGLIQLDAHQVRVTPTGRSLIRNICMTFDRYQREVPRTAFSKAL